MILLGLLPFAGLIVVFVFVFVFVFMVLGPDPAARRFDQSTGH